MNDLINYSKQYPHMPLEILKFFAKNEQKDGKVIQKQVHHFCEYFSKKFATDNYPQPRVVSKICDILCDNQKLSLISKAGPDNINSSYWCSLNENVEKDSALEKFLEQHLAHIVFGFKFIYEDFKSRVLPIEYEDKAGNLYLGTCFLYQHGIVTAKHCVEGAKGISIKGFSAEQLYSAKYETSPNPLLDLIFITFPNPLDGTLMLNSDAEILDEVMTLGYPKIAGYHNFLTAENAVISARYTASTGQVAANAEDIWMKEKLFLITAKIKGGNSGGPVVNRSGAIIGVSVNQSEGEGDYDSLGYGTVIPIKFLDALIVSEQKTFLSIKDITFKDFI